MPAGFPLSAAVIRGGTHSQPSVGRMKLALRIGHESVRHIDCHRKRWRVSLRVRAQLSPRKGFAIGSTSGTGGGCVVNVLILNQLLDGGGDAGGGGDTGGDGNTGGDDDTDGDGDGDGDADWVDEIDTGSDIDGGEVGFRKIGSIGSLSSRP